MSDEAQRKLDLYERFVEVNSVDPSFYEKYNVKRGLRNSNGTGVIAGVTNISNVHGYLMSDADKVPDEGRLTFRGYNIYDLIANSAQGGRFGFEEVAYLLICGHLPNHDQMEFFKASIEAQRELPDGFVASYLMSNTSANLMNMLSRSLLMMYYDDPNSEDRTFQHEIATSIKILSRLPRIMVLSYYAKQAKFNNSSMVIHPPIPGQSTAETILSALRPNREFTAEEARMLDVLLTLHAEHGGGNNSTFTCRVLSSADTDPYSCYAAALGSLKGSKHGGANHMVRAMQAEIKENVSNWENEDEIADYLAKIVRKEAFDHSGLIYGMGHAVYTKSDPRAVICKQYASKLASGTEFEAEYKLIETIERLTPQIMRDVKGSKKDMCANIDMYTGFVYSMMGIPEDLFTPLFACGRIAGWSAHRFEEIVSGKRIIRPAYKSATARRDYVPMDEREN